MRRLSMFILAVAVVAILNPVPTGHDGHLGRLVHVHKALAQAATLLETFSGAPGSPAAWRPTTWDVQTNVTDSYWGDGASIEPMQAHHSAACGGPPATHPISRIDETVFLCNDHVMTAMNAGYGAVYLTPNAMVDFGGGEAVVRFDMSTFRTVGRDWVDLWITPFEDNLAVPLEDWGPAYQGEPRRSVHIRLDGSDGGTIFKGEVIRDFAASGLSGAEGRGYEQFLTPSASRRDTFELRISRTRVRFGMPAYNAWWVDSSVADLGWSRGVVQFAHHAYNPTKGCDESHGGADPTGACANTWHWDNVSIAPAAPFTILRGSPRLASAATTSQVTFPAPAPPNAFLRFAGVGSNLEVSFNDGQTWQPVQRQAQEANKVEHWATFWTPMPAGTTSVRLRGQTTWAGPWVAQDIAVFAATPSATPPPLPPPPPPVVCNPRPKVTVSTVASGGQLQVTVSAATSSQVPNNRLRQLRFGAATNARIDAGGQTGRTGNFTVSLPANTTQTTFTVRRGTAATPPLSTTVPIIVADDCGDWTTFVGGGPTAF
jgi:hypothetical protein